MNPPNRDPKKQYPPGVSPFAQGQGPQQDMLEGGYEDWTGATTLDPSAVPPPLTNPPSVAPDAGYTYFDPNQAAPQDGGQAYQDFFASAQGEAVPQSAQFAPGEWDNVPGGTQGKEARPSGPCDATTVAGNNTCASIGKASANPPQYSWKTNEWGTTYCVEVGCGDPLPPGTPEPPEPPGPNPPNVPSWQDDPYLAAMTQSVGAPTDMGEWTEGALGSLLGAGDYAAGQGVLGEKATNALAGLIDTGAAVPAYTPQTGAGIGARGGIEQIFQQGGMDPGNFRTQLGTGVQQNLKGIFDARGLVPPHIQSYLGQKSQQHISELLENQGRFAPPPPYADPGIQQLDPQGRSPGDPLYMTGGIKPLIPYGAGELAQGSFAPGEWDEQCADPTFAKENPGICREIQWPTDSGPAPDPALARQIESARSPLDILRRAQMSQGAAALADRGLVGSGAGRQYLEGLEGQLAPQYTQAAQQIMEQRRQADEQRYLQALQMSGQQGMQQDQMRDARWTNALQQAGQLSQEEVADRQERYLTAIQQGEGINRDEAVRRDQRLQMTLQQATGLDAQRVQNILSTASTVGERQQMVSNLALQSLNQNMQWNKFLAEFGLDRAQVMNDIQNQRLDRIMPMLQMYTQTMQGLGSGYTYHDPDLSDWADFIRSNYEGQDDGAGEGGSGSQWPGTESTDCGSISCDTCVDWMNDMYENDGECCNGFNLPDDCPDP